MKATHLWAVRNCINAHMNYIEQIRASVEKRINDKDCEHIKNYLKGISDAYDSEWEYLNAVQVDISDYIDDLEGEELEDKGHYKEVSK